MIRIDVDLADRSYPVLVGAGAIEHLGEVLPTGVGRVAIVTQASIPVSASVSVDLPVKTFFIEEGEPAKTLSTVEELCSGFAQFGLTRRDCVVAVGGGLVTDLAGFAAAIYHRGVAVVQVPTTLLGQVDAAIGGKTGANLAEGKNLVGAFWQPSAVLCDTATLDTLPPRELLSGMGEVAKYHFLGSRVGIDTSNLGELSLDERVARCVALKGKVVSVDEREGSLRAILNYGHTLAHALEIAGNFDLRHGEAVAIGLHFAALLAQRLGRIDQHRVDDHLRVLHGYGLPSRLPANANLDELISLMRRDKKSAGTLTFVLDGPNGVELVANVDPVAVEKTLLTMN